MAIWMSFIIYKCRKSNLKWIKINANLIDCFAARYQDFKSCDSFGNVVMTWQDKKQKKIGIFINISSKKRLALIAVSNFKEW